MEQDRHNIKRIQDEIRKVFMRDWDPIGVNDEPACADEYDRYIGPALSILVNGGTDDDLREHLGRAENESMSLTPNVDAIERTVRALRLIPMT